MEIKYYILLTLVSIGFLSCSKKNGDPAPDTADYPKLIVGKWKEGPATENYYTAGKLVYTATSHPGSYYDQYNTDGTLIVSQLQSDGTYSVYANYNYSLTNSNTKLNATVLGRISSIDQTISFTDNNTMITTTVRTGGTYTDAKGVTVVTDSITVIETLIRQ